MAFSKTSELAAKRSTLGEVGRLCPYTPRRSARTVSIEIRTTLQSAHKASSRAGFEQAASARHTAALIETARAEARRMGSGIDGTLSSPRCNVHSPQTVTQ